MNTEITRKDFLNLLWGAVGTVAFAELGLVGLRFLSPQKTAGQFGGEFNLGDYTRFPEGSVTPVEAGRFYLVRLADGGFLAVYRSCTHLGCAVPFDQATGQFICPCHGSRFTTEGEVLNAPAPRPLDLFSLRINEQGEIVVDTGAPIKRDDVDAKYIVYAEGNS